jgi:Putative zinc-finger
MSDEGRAMSHEQMRAELPELAADVLDGRERAQLLDHVDSCPSCTVELEELTMAADSLVHLTVEADPPVGFETRVFEEMRRRPAGVSRRRWARHRPLLVAASAAAAAVLAFALGWAVHAGTGPVRHTVSAPTPADHLVEAPLVSHGRTVGVVSLYSNAQAWLSMSVEGSPWSGPVRCTVTSAVGAVRTVGSFSLTSGHGTWIAQLPVSPGSVRTASMVAPGGRVLAIAHFGKAPPTRA